MRADGDHECMVELICVFMHDLVGDINSQRTSYSANLTC